MARPIKTVGEKWKGKKRVELQHLSGYMAGYDTKAKKRLPAIKGTGYGKRIFKGRRSVTLTQYKKALKKHGTLKER